jgi:hypothetical protein
MLSLSLCLRVMGFHLEIPTEIFMLQVVDWINLAEFGS